MLQPDHDSDPPTNADELDELPEFDLDEFLDEDDFSDVT